MPNFNAIDRNMSIISDVLKTGDEKAINHELDKLLNTIRINYESKKDFVENFPDQNDMTGKIKLIVNRRK